MNNFYYENFRLEVTEVDRERVLLAEVARPSSSIKSLRETVINLAADINRSISKKPLALMLDDSYESMVMLLGFHHSGADFKTYLLDFAGPSEDKKNFMVGFVKKHTGRDLHPITFDFSNAEHMEGLDKLRAALSPRNPLELFNLWFACNIDEVPVFPGRFVTPTYTQDGFQKGWDIPNNDDLTLHAFLKDFGGVPSFFTASPELVWGQLGLISNNYFRDICDSQQRKLSNKNPVFRKLLAAEFSFAELANFQEPARPEPEFKTALKKFSRKTKEDLACILHRTRTRDYAPKLKSNLSFEPVNLPDVARGELAYKQLFQESENAMFTGAVLETEKSSAGQCLAIFPTLVSVHEYGGDMAQVDTTVRNLEFFYNLNNNYTRTDIHGEEGLKDLVTFFKACSTFYFKKMGYIYEDFEIVQCWANKAGYKQIHHAHRHPNSMLSGIFYVTEGWGGTTAFIKHNDSELVPNLSEFNVWNSTMVQIRPSRCRLVLFPSWLEHYVAEHENKKSERYTVAFNVMLRGEIGDLTRGSWLNL